MAEPEPQHQALYRRYRPQRFSEVKGQDHITRGLLNAVRDDRVGHAYLFSGPRGTGKTSTARILAKALNCTKLDDGEPCGVCESCIAVQGGSGYDVIEMDAASNNGVDAMRDLVARTALGTPGRKKVYIVDEVHMLSAAASNTLLKTLEEPPDHVVFVLATTDPQKVLATIRSRVQHFEFHLLGADVLQDIVRFVHDDAALGLADADLATVVRRGAGSARDALSVLDQAAALGGAIDEVPVASEVVEAITAADAGRALVAVADGMAAGRDPRRIGDEILQHLRLVFLMKRAPALVDVDPTFKALLADQADRLPPAAILRAMEVVGEALAEMREALDPRITLEVSLVRVAAPEADVALGALLERVERLERLERTAPADAKSTSPVAKVAAPPPSPTRTAPQPPPPPPPKAPSAPATMATPDGEAAELPSREKLTIAWGDTILPSLPTRVRNRMQVGRFSAVEGGAAHFALPDKFQVERCTEVKNDVETALHAHFGAKVPIKLVIDDGGPQAARTRGAAPVPAPDDEVFSTEGLADASGPSATSPSDRLKQAFPGAEEVGP